ncbi:succinate dehydrogenase, cytochrome b556 subunit [Azonexus sp.]|uniref:succinate dehydrogenase, cytochrome b556 subunit n=1 Tax=Azonexus sp. TaxID=1872668 RepID=UPI0035B17400
MAEMMIKKKQRPRNLDLASLRSYSLPLPGKVSIFHRVSGLGLFLMLPVILWLFQASVTSPETFAVFQGLAAAWPVKVILAGLIWAYAHHFCAGIRFLLMDVHVGVDKAPARKSAAAVFAVSIPLSIILWGVLL